MPIVKQKETEKQNDKKTVSKFPRTNKPRLSSRKMQDLIRIINRAEGNGNTHILSEIFKTCNSVAHYDLRARRVMSTAVSALTRIHNKKYPS